MIHGIKIGDKTSSPMDRETTRRRSMVFDLFRKVGNTAVILVAGVFLCQFEAKAEFKIGVSKERRQSAQIADVIVVCSDWEQLKPTDISEFHKRVFPDMRHPHVIDAREYNSNRVKNTVFFLAIEENSKSEIAKCLESFPGGAKKYNSLLTEMAEKVGSKPMFASDPALLKHLLPFTSATRFIQSENWIGILYMTDTESISNIKGALIELYGLKASFCTTTNKCDYLDKKSK